RGPLGGAARQQRVLGGEPAALGGRAAQVRRQLVLDRHGRDHAGAAPGHQRRALGVGEEAGRDLDVAQLRREPTVPGGRHRHLSRSPSHRSRTRGELTRVGPGTRAPPAFGYPAVWGRSGETMAFLDAELKEQVRQVLSPLQEEVELVVYRGSGLIVPGRDQPGEERAMLELAREVAETSDKV